MMITHHMLWYHMINCDNLCFFLIRYHRKRKQDRNKLKKQTPSHFQRHAHRPTQTPTHQPTHPHTHPHTQRHPQTPTQADRQTHTDTQTHTNMISWSRLYVQKALTWPEDHNCLGLPVHQFAICSHHAQRGFLVQASCHLEWCGPVPGLDMEMWLHWRHVFVCMLKTNGQTSKNCQTIKEENMFDPEVWM